VTLAFSRLVTLTYLFTYLHLCDRCGLSFCYFYRATRMYSADYAVARCLSICLSVRPSVCLSVTRRCSDETAKHIIKLFSPSGSHTILVFFLPYGMVILRWVSPNQGIECKRGIKQKLSYRRQIARKLRTQYVDGISSNPVTLKFKLTVTQSHWKRNHWIDHI